MPPAAGVAAAAAAAEQVGVEPVAGTAVAAVDNAADTADADWENKAGSVNCLAMKIRLIGSDAHRLMDLCLT
jgi:hypothetical protein